MCNILNTKLIFMFINMNIFAYTLLSILTLSCYWFWSNNKCPYSTHFENTSRHYVLPLNARRKWECILVRFHVLTAASMNMTASWDAAPCSLVEVCLCFRGVQHPSSGRWVTLMIEAESTSETSLNFYQTTRLNIPEDSHIQDLIMLSAVK
jgi:hypothetical protein